MSSFIKKFLWLVVIIIVAVSCIAVANNFSASTGKKELKIGVIVPLTGPRADAGEYTQNAIKLAKEDIEKVSEGNIEPNFILEDSKYEAPVAVSAAQKLISIDKVKYIIGPFGSSEVLAVGPIAEKEKVLLLATAAQTEEISSLGDYVFRLIHNTKQEAPIFAKFVSEHMKGETLPFLVLNTAVSDPYIKSFTPNFEVSGKKIGLIEKYDAKETDFKTHLLKIKASNPADIFLVAVPKGAGMILKQARALGMTSQFYNIGVEGPDLVKEAGKYADGLYYSYSYDSTSNEPAVSDFYNRYKTRFGTEPDAIAANAYDAAMLIYKCVMKDGESSDAVKRCLYQTKEYRGAGGTFSFDENGDVIKPIFTKTIKDGKFVKL